jgi:lipopolysaccharide assembly outer membrane protein LptD (OstA)
LSTPGARRGILLVAVLLLGTGAVAGQELEGEPGGLLEQVEEIRFQRSRQQGDELVLTGNVEFTGGGAKIHADRVVYRKDLGTVDAIGNVVFSFPGATLTGSTLHYRLEDGTGYLEDVTGYLEEDQAILRARRVERLGPRRLRVEDAVFTTCTQPTPYWSFRIDRGTFDLGEYAYLRGVAFRTARVPVFYTPYLVWPIKTGRAAGLLFPDFSRSDNLGQSISVPVYWPFADNADLTVLLDGHTKVGFALGAELRWLPTYRGNAVGEGYWIDDRVRDRSRYRYAWRHNQTLPWQFQLKANAEVISDYDYVIDYETDLERAATPQTLSTVDVTRNWSWTSLSLRARRHEQYFVAGGRQTNFLSSKVINQVLPEMELRGRSFQLGETPLYLSFVSSVSRFRRIIERAPEATLGVLDEEELVTTADNEWERVDFAPRLRMPVLQATWADLTLSTGWRGTWYSARANPEDPEQLESDPLWRSLWDAGLNLAGPRFQRVFETPEWDFSPKLKHVIEPFLNYFYRPSASVEQSEIIRVDSDVDVIASEASTVSYGVRQRFHVLRPPSTGGPSPLLTARETSFAGIEREEERARRQEAQEGAVPALEPEVALTERLNPIEIGSIEILQSYSFIDDLSREISTEVDPDTGTLVTLIDGAPYSPVTIKGRFNPADDKSIDFAYLYDVFRRRPLETQVSALLRVGPRAYAEARWFRRAALSPQSRPQSFLRSRGGWASPGGRFRIEAEIDYDLETSELVHHKYRTFFATQCARIELSYDIRNFANNDRSEVYLAIDLTGLGPLFDVSHRLQ